MIRINLLGVERQKARKAAGLRHRPAADRRVQPDPGRGVCRHRLVVLVARRGIRAARRGDRRRAAGGGAAAVAARRGPAVRGAAQAAAAARPAHRAAARRAERAGAAARPRQPEPARHAVADRRWSRTATAVTIEGRSTTLIALSDFVGNLGNGALLKKPIEIVEQPGRFRARGRRRPGCRVDQVHGARRSWRRRSVARWRVPALRRRTRLATPPKPKWSESDMAMN